MRLIHSVSILALLGCSPSTERRLTPSQRQAISAEIEQTLREAYDLSKPGLTQRMIALYPESGRVISANSGRAITSRDTLDAGIRYFWDNVGVNMREATWEWERFWVDVLSPTAAVVTATYRVPHRNPRNEPHVIGGAMTMVFEKRRGRWVIVQEHLSDIPQTTDTLHTSMPTHDHH